MDIKKKDIITLENKKDYLIIDIVKFDNNDYVYLINIEDKKDIVCYKIVTIDNKNVLKKLDNVQELESVMKIIINNNLQTDS